MGGSGGLSEGSVACSVLRMALREVRVIAGSAGDTCPGGGGSSSEEKYQLTEVCGSWAQGQSNKYTCAIMSFYGMYVHTELPEANHSGLHCRD